MKNLLLMLTLLVSSVSMAKMYGEAGCGLGSIVIGSSGNQVLAATTNHTGIQTFGITSGTSNCIDDGAVASSKSVPVYIEVNKIALAKDAARGEGETLAGLARLMGCDSKQFGSTLKSNYNKIFVESHMQPSVIQDSIVNSVQSDKQLACGV